MIVCVPYIHSRTPQSLAHGAGRSTQHVQDDWMSQFKAVEETARRPSRPQETGENTLKTRGTLLCRTRYRLVKYYPSQLV